MAKLGKPADIILELQNSKALLLTVACQRTKMSENGGWNLALVLTGPLKEYGIK